MKIAICTPSRDIVHAAFAFDLAQMGAYWMAKNAPSGGNLLFLTSMGTLIADQRVNLAKEALEANADWILWLDTDMRFPMDLLDRLLKHRQPIVGCNYPTRVVPPRPTAQIHRNEVWLPVYTDESKDGLEQVDLLGFGAVLTSTHVFKKLESPWFHLVYSTVNNEFHGEDAFFCMKAAQAGFPVYIDHDVSKEIRHIGSFEFRHEHAKITIEEGA